MDESVKRDGCRVTVQIGGISCERVYESPSGAKRAEYKLLMDRRARERFFRPIRPIPQRRK